MNLMRLSWVGFFAVAVLCEPVAAADRVDDAVKRGVKFLVANQIQDGAADQKGVFVVADDPVRWAARNTYPMTALAVMAMAAVGHQPTEPGEAGKAMQLGIDFIIRPNPQRDRSNGYFGVDGSRMYGHGITTLCLGEILGMGVDKAQDRRIRPELEKAVDLILRAQQVPKFAAVFTGGWRYEPGSNDADLSISVWQVMALRSAQNAGLRVPPQSIDLAVKYLERSYQSPRDARGRPSNLRTGFGYVPQSRPTFATTAAGLLSLQVCNKLDAPEVIGAANYLEDIDLKPDLMWFFYGAYYYAQGMQKRANDDPNSEGSRQAKLGRENVERVMLQQQKADGSWEATNRAENDVGKIYCTAMAILSLSVKYHFLPIYQH